MQEQGTTLDRSMASLNLNIISSLCNTQRENFEMLKAKAEIGHIGQQINDDLQKPELSSKLSTMAGGEGCA